MCIPGASAFEHIQSAMNLASTINEVQTQKKEAKYRTQIAINNAKNAQNEALRQKQMGIEESRKEKVLGIQEANKKLVQNASNGFSALDGTNQFLYQDIHNQADYKSDKITSLYNLRADSYFNKANDFLNQANKYSKDYNSSMFQKGMQYLGNVNKVAQNWYEKKSDEVSYDYI